MHVLLALLVAATAPFLPLAMSQAPVGTAFTYQGELREAGLPVNNPAGQVRFSLFDAATGGTQIGSSIPLSNVNIVEGLFTVSLDFGPSAFGTAARWLEIAVYKTGTGWVVLTPRQRVTPTPQAQVAAEAANLTWPVAASYAGALGVNEMLQLDYAGDGRALEVNATGADAYAIFGSTTEFDTVAVYGQVAGEVSTGVVGYATATGADVANVGGAFVARGDRGVAVFGHATSSTGANYGVRGESNSATGYAGYFQGRGYFSGNLGIGVDQPTQKLDVAGMLKATGLQLANAPVAGYVLTSDASGVGTWQPAGAASCLWHASGNDIYYNTGNVAIGVTDDAGYSLRVRNNNSGTAIAGECPGEANYGYLGDEYAGVRGEGHTGVQGKSGTTSGVGVLGENNAATGATCGVHGRVTSPTGRGVYGEATAGTGTPVGVEAYAGSPSGMAISAMNDAESGSAVGVRAATYSADGFAVWGSVESAGTTGSGAGVRGETLGAGAGVYGKATHATAAAYGVKGEAASASGYGGYFLGRGYFSGNVGIGVTNPAQKLDVAGTIQSTGLKLTTSPAAGYVLTSDAAGVASWQPASDGVWEEDGSSIYFTGGNVGIGTMTPAAPLDIAGGNWDLVGTEGDLRIGSPSYRLKFGVATAGASAGLARLRAQATAGAPKIVLGAGSFDVLTVTSTNVGVGTLVPDTNAKLDVNGKIKGTTLQVTTGATAGHVLTADASGNATWQAPTGSGELTLPWEGSGADSIAAFRVTNTHATTGAGIFGVGTDRGLRGDGGNEGVYGFSSTGRGVSGSSNSGIGVRAQSSGTGTENPALRVNNINNNGIGIFSTCGSTDANAVFVNTGAGDIIKGFSGATGGDLVFRVENNGKTSVSVLQITGGADLSEQFDVAAPGGALEPGMVVCIDPANPGKLVVSTKAYDRTVAGIISGAGGVQPGMLMGQQGTAADGQHPVALTGRVYTWADATNGAIEPGDLLTTAQTPGHAMKVTDYERSQGAIIGKAMTRLAQGETGLVLVLVSLQ